MYSVTNHVFVLFLSDTQNAVGFRNSTAPLYLAIIPSKTLLNTISTVDAVPPPHLVKIFNVDSTHLIPSSSVLKTTNQQVKLNVEHYFTKVDRNTIFTVTREARVKRKH